MQAAEGTGNLLVVQKAPSTPLRNHNPGRISHRSQDLHSDEDQDADNHQNLKIHERTNYAMTTGAKAKHQRDTSPKTSLTSSHSSMDGINNSIPQPLPIFDGRAQNEPNLHAGFRRLTLVKQTLADEILCPHQNQNNIENWVCKDCNQHVPQFDCIFDDNQGRVHQFLKICFENQFLADFQYETLDQQVVSPKVAVVANSSATTGVQQQSQQQKAPSRPPDVIYSQYQAQNVTQLREYMLYCISKDQQIAFTNQQSQPNGQPQEPTVTIEGQPVLTEPESQRNTQQAVDQADQAVDQIFKTGQMSHLTVRLTKYLLEMQENFKALQRRYQGNILQIDSIFESGNLLQAEKAETGEYRLYMQVDTNTKGHQQWFNYRVRNTRKGKKYTFQIMNFTKPGVTGGSGYRKSELKQRIMYKSNLCGHQEWKSISSGNLEFVKTKVQRRKKDVVAAGADSDQDEEVEEFFGNETGTGAGNEGVDFSRAATMGMNSGPTTQMTLKKKKVFYYYSLVFDFEFEHDQDTVYFAFSQPYTYSQIVRDFLTIEQQIQPTDKSLVRQLVKYQVPEVPVEPVLKVPEPLKKQKTSIQSQSVPPPAPIEATLIVKQPMTGVSFENKQLLIYYRREELCRSVCGLPLWQITITRDSKPQKKKPVILITSRVHSGETPASMVFKGMLEFLVSDKKEAKFLRRFYTFILLPCLNPDGVVCGNYRNSVSGVDLNRQWINPEEEFQPEVFYTKNLFKKITEQEKRHIWIYCDLHGHSKKTNSFFYGCNTAANGGFLSWTIVRLLPRIFAQKTHMFNFKDCRFKVEPYKIGTGRVVAWKQFQITHSFTLENSFFGYDFGEDESREFSEEDYFSVGSKFCDSVYEFHYVWKQIQRELNVTNGWLKPRVLIEKTGVPAAQLLQEELAKKKKDELKLQAIEQYQQFLRKFYNGAKSKQPKLFGAKAGLALPGLSSETDANEAHQLWLRNSADITQGQPNTSQEFIGESNKNTTLVHYLESLVKLQALIRRFLVRTKIAPKLLAMKQKRLAQKRETNKITLPVLPSETGMAAVNQTNAGILNSSIPKLLTIPPANLIINQPDSQDSQSQSGVGKISTRRFEIMSRDWRTYFQEEELEKAFQVVEIEQRDIPEENSSDDGSNSNPSEDNFAADEIYENVYCLPEDKTKKILEETQNQKQNLLTQIRKQSPISAAQLYSRLKNTPGSNAISGSGVNAARNGQKLGRLQSGMNITNQTNGVNQTSINADGLLRVGSRGNQANAQSQNQLQVKNGQSPYQNSSQLLSKSQALKSGMNNEADGNSELTRLQNSYNQARIDSFLSREYNTTTHKYAVLQQGRALQSALNRGQLRANTAHGSDVYLGGPVASSIMPNTSFINKRPKDSGSQFKYYKLSQIGKYSKRENISQVIKDCFITKQCGLPRPLSKQASRINPATQKVSQNYPKYDQLANQRVVEHGRSFQKSKLITSDKKTSNISSQNVYKEVAKDTFTLINYDAHMQKKTKRTQLISEERRSISPRNGYGFATTQQQQSGPPQVYQRDLNQQVNQQLKQSDQNRPRTTIQSGAGLNPMGGIRVVKQPNSNLTYLQVYPRPDRRQHDYI